MSWTLAVPLYFVLFIDPLFFLFFLLIQYLIGFILFTVNLVLHIGDHDVGWLCSFLNDLIIIPITIINQKLTLMTFFVHFTAGSSYMDLFPHFYFPWLMFCCLWIIKLKPYTCSLTVFKLDLSTTGTCYICTYSFAPQQETFQQ